MSRDLAEHLRHLAFVCLNSHMGFIRFILAISVLMSHSGGFAGYAMAAGDVAVQTFFLISGFLIQLVLSRRYDPRDDYKLFLSNRLLRIFPLYLTCFVLTILCASLVSGIDDGYIGFIRSRISTLAPSDIALLAVTSISIVGQEAFLFLDHGVRGLFFGGTIDPLVWPLQPLPQAWSLSLELMFYILAPLLARGSTRLLWAIVSAGLILKLVLALYGLDYDPWTDRFFPTALPLFVLGMLAYRHRDSLPLRRIHQLTIIGLFIVATLLMSLRHAASQTTAIPVAGFDIAYTSLALLALPILFRWSSRSDVGVVRRIDGRLAELSYPIYVCHWFVLKTIEALLPHAEGIEKAERSLLFIVVTIVVAWALVAVVERPVDAFRSKRRHG